MKTSDFKEIEHFNLPVKIDSATTTPLNDQRSAVVKPALSLFHRLPKMSPAIFRPGADEKSNQNPNHSSYEQGKSEGEAKASLVYQDTIKLMETALETLQAQYASIRSDVESSHLQAVSQCLKAILPQLATRSAEIQIADVIQSLSAVVIQDRVELHVHPSQTESVKAMLEKQTAQPDKFAIIADPAIQPFALECKWNAGGISIDTATVANQCLDVLEQANSSSTKSNGEP